MTVVRLEFDVPDEKATDLANALARTYSIQPGRVSTWTSVNVRLLTGFEVQRERTLLAAAQYFYPPPPGEPGVSHDDGH